ncbi:MAG: hypothetical protein ABR881_32275 [Candidatus Sulfotelmatobacter sp.]|jgi:hypothetical protein
MTNPWAFGWTQLLTIIGFVITVLIAVGGFRSFERWRREKIEEKRIDAAVDALVLIREAKWVFENMRSLATFEYEWKDMPVTGGDDEGMRRSKGSFYAILKRIEGHRQFFERAWKLQIRCGALFGQRAEDALLLLQKARREVEISAGMLTRDPMPTVRTEENVRTWEKFKTDVWQGYSDISKVRDSVAEKLEECNESIEAICRPVLDRQFGKKKRTWLGSVLEWLGL